MVSPTPFRAADFKSAYGPKYNYQPNVAGWNFTSIRRVLFKTGFFGGAAGVGLVLFASSLPRVQQDILMKVPFLTKYYEKDIHPADNPF